MENCQRVVIIGAGFGGLTTAVRLAALRKDKECVITVIDRNTHHLYTPLVYEVATGWCRPAKEPGTCASPREERELSEGAVIWWDDLRAQFSEKGIHVVYDEVVGIDWGKKEVVLSSERRMPYDQVVIGVGGTVDHYGIEGLAEHSHNLYSLHQALAIRRHLYDLVEKRLQNKIPRIRVMVGGAGPAGVEFAAELAGCFRSLVRHGVLTASDWSIDLVEAANRPLPGFHKDLSKWATSRLEKLGVRFILDACIKGAHKDHVVLVPRPLKAGESVDELVCDFRKESQKEITTDLLVWAGGLKANPLLAKIGVQTDRRGKIEIDRTLRIRGQEAAWAIGDSSSLIDPKTNMPVPPLAQAAIKQGDFIAMNLVRAMRKRPLLNYDFPHMHAVIPLGGSYGVAEVFGIRLRGHIIGALRFFAEARYYFSTFPFPEAWKILITGAKVYSRNN